MITQMFVSCTISDNWLLIGCLIQTASDANLIQAEFLRRLSIDDAVIIRVNYKVFFF
jgi:hypothetical protein